MPIWLLSFGKSLGLKGMVAAGLGLALAVMFMVHKGDVRAKERLRNQVAQTEARLAVSNGSIELLQAKISELNTEANARAAAYEASKARAAKETARLAAQARTSDSVIARLRALANQPGDERCLADPGLLAELEGL